MGSGNKAGVLVIDDRNRAHLLLRYYPYGKPCLGHWGTDSYWKEIYSRLALTGPLKDASGMEIRMDITTRPLASRAPDLWRDRSQKDNEPIPARMPCRRNNHRRTASFDATSIAVAATTALEDPLDDEALETGATSDPLCNSIVYRVPGLAAKSKDNFFWEQLQIPRGSRTPRESSIMAAFREFYEETGYLPTGRGTLCRDYFILKWIDDSVLWTYTIYLLFLDSNSLVYIPNNAAVYWSFEHAGGVNDTIKCNIQCSQTKSISRGAIHERKFFQHVKVVLSRYRKFMDDVFVRAKDVAFHNYSGLFGLIEDFTNDINNCRHDHHYTIEFNVT